MVSVAHVRPVSSKIEIDIPVDYIDKEIEILIQPVERPAQKKVQEGSILELQGILGEADFDAEIKEKAIK